MVLWEIALGTAYFLGLKRTYRLGLKAQRRIISSNYPKIRQFAHRRTRGVFDMVLKAHKTIQERDIEVGKSFGNWILRFLDKAKPSAEIRVKHLSSGTTNANPIRQLTNGNTNANPIRNLADSSKLKISQNLQKIYAKSGIKESDRNFIVGTRNLMPKSFPNIAMIMKPIQPAGTNIHYRPFSTAKFGYGVMREDIRQWLKKN